MNKLSKGVKIIICLITGFLGFLFIPGIWIAWQKSLGYKTPGVVFLIIIWSFTAAAIKGIWRYKTDENNSSKKPDKYRLDKT